jgi:hypothetical protein
LRATRALRPPQKTVSHSGTATIRHDRCESALCADASPVAEAEQRRRRKAAAKAARSAGNGRSEIHACECGSGGWPGPHSFCWCRLSSPQSARPIRGSATAQGETCPPKLWLHHRFIHQQDWNVVPHRINAVAVAALQTLARFLLHQRLFAHRANQDFKKL